MSQYKDHKKKKRMNTEGNDFQDKFKSVNLDDCTEENSDDDVRLD